MNLPKLHSVTKKILVALLGGFLLLFLLFHATANLFVLRHDDGAWYSAFCHFMGENWIVKIFEVVLLGCLALHVVITLWLALTNRLARPVRYHQSQRSTTHTTSKLMMWTGILIFAFLVMHFCQFYFVKIGWVKGEYMVKTEKLQSDELMGVVQYAQSMNMTPEEFIGELENEAMMYADENGDAGEVTQYIDGLRDKLAVLDILQRAQAEGNFSQDGAWIRHLTYDERQTLKHVMPESKPEPDFYFMVRELFHNPLMVLLYLIAFVALFMHMRHAFPSAFQTLGLNNYKYNNIIEWCGRAYAWLICLMFTAVPVLVFLGL
ncbi:MAG: succinate dehydrogenase cytochrome b subunit [Bacteroidales bacterium]|nr:succinate dehydrogenase cytochrome b subunit [Bacteroidales bacterium]